MAEATAVLRPYLPRLVLDWVTHDPTASWKAVDGTFVFADLSGFTQMSERLARLGRVGAEEVTDAIGACFAELLGIAYADGGGLVKFGGDALFLLFDGPGHVTRATRTAAGMRARLRTAGRIATSAGQVTLRMSIGIHSGSFHCFLVGGTSRELLVAGPATSTVVAMEHVATAGRIVLSPDTASALPEGCSGATIGPGILLRRPPSGPEPDGFPFLAPLDGVDLAAYVPTEVRDHALGGGSEPEHRTVTVGFVHFGGLDARLRRDGPEHTADALHELVTSVEVACEQYGVALLATDVDTDGGKLMLAAGAPRARGHDEERMLAAARQIVDAGSSVPVAIGVHRGAVFAGDVGPTYRRTYTVMGDIVNVAARLMAAAAPGQIVASAAVVDRAVGFAASPLPPFTVKGKRAPVTAYAVGGARRALDERPTPTGLQLPFVGRAAELAALEEMLAGARGGRGSVVELVGPSGVGKSRFVRELRRRSPEFRSVTVTCEPYESSTPYAAIWWLFHDLLDLAEDAPPDEVDDRLRRAVREQAPHLAPWLPLLGLPLDLELPDTPETAGLAPRFRRQRAAEVIAAFLNAQLPGPTVLVFEDTQWMDDTSRELVELLVGKVDDTAWIVGCTRVDDGVALVDATVVRLAPLDRRDAVDALRRATEDRPLRPHELDAITDRAEGNPLFLTELLRVARESPLDGTLPDSIDALVTAQIDRLPPARRRLLRYAAVLGRSFSRRDLEDLLSGELPTPDDSTWRDLADFVELEGGTRARFRHALIRDTAYEELSYRRRRELHARAGRMLEESLGDRTDVEAEILSLHFFEAQSYPDAWRYARLAGVRARNKFANTDAAALFERATAAARRLPELPREVVAEVWEALGDVRDRSGDYDAAVAAYRAARRLVRGEPVREAALMLKEAWIPERIGRYTEALRWIRKGQRMLEGVDDPEAARCRAQLAAWYGAIRHVQGRHRDAIKWCHRAIDEAVASGDRKAEAHASFILDWAHIDLGETDQATHSARALELYEELDDLSGQAGVLNNVGMFAYWQGRWDEALELYERARALELRTGDAVNAATAAVNIAELLADQGRLDEAEARAHEARRVFRAAHYGYNSGWSTSLLGRIAARRGAYPEALRCFAEAREEFVAAELHDDVMRADAWIAETYALRGDPTRALANADDALRRARTEGGISAEAPLLERVRGYALAQSGDAAAARAAFDASLEAARARGADYEIALTLHALARIGGGDADATARERESRTILDRLGVEQLAEPPLTAR